MTSRVYFADTCKVRQHFVTSVIRTFWQFGAKFQLALAFKFSHKIVAFFRAVVSTFFS